MADLHRTTLIERDVEQAIVALKKGAYLLKYGRRGKPKFCPFRLANVSLVAFMIILSLGLILSVFLFIRHNIM